MNLARAFGMGYTRIRRRKFVAQRDFLWNSWFFALKARLRLRLSAPGGTLRSGTYIGTMTAIFETGI